MLWLTVYIVKTTPSGCLVSGPPPSGCLVSGFSNYSNCKFLPLLALHMYSMSFCHFLHLFNQADLYLNGYKCLYIYMYISMFIKRDS